MILPAILKEVPEHFFMIQETILLDGYVQDIVQDVKRRGDGAVIEYTKKFDKRDLMHLEVTPKQIDQAFQSISEDTLKSLYFAIESLQRFATEQLKAFQNITLEVPFGSLGHTIIPIEKVGVYVPGGRYPLPSSALMTIIPAKIAGVEKIIMCSPKITDETIVAGVLAGANQIFNIGGAQAIAAMAYGTASIEKVDKIVGPGNKYVNTAKMLVSSFCGIDMYAGPSEIVILADHTANPTYIAADMLAQAEHDVEASAHLMTTSSDLALKVREELSFQLKNLSTRDVAQEALHHSYIILVNDLEEAIHIANKKAPEHLEIFVEAPDPIVSKLKNYGSLFIGEGSAEVFGDYCSGTNHVLPTNGVARYRGGLSVYDFLKVLTYQNIHDHLSAVPMIKTAMHLAHIEGLQGHYQAGNIRLDFLKKRYI